MKIGTMAQRRASNNVKNETDKKGVLSVPSLTGPYSGIANPNYVPDVRFKVFKSDGKRDAKLSLPFGARTFVEQYEDALKLKLADLDPMKTYRLRMGFNFKIGINENLVKSQVGISAFMSVDRHTVDKIHSCHELAFMVEVDHTKNLVATFDFNISHDSISTVILGESYIVGKWGGREPRPLMLGCRKNMDLDEWLTFKWAYKAITTLPSLSCTSSFKPNFIEIYELD